MIKVYNVEVLENPCSFLQPFHFKITFTVDEDVKNNECEWKIVYVGSAESKDFDQVLLSESVGSYSKGQHDLILRSAPIDPNKIPKEELMEPSVVLLLGYLNFKQIFQVGYIVTKEYLDDEQPEKITDYDKLQRRIINESARIVSDNEDLPMNEPILIFNSENVTLDLMNSILDKSLSLPITENLDVSDIQSSTLGSFNNSVID